MLLLTVEAIWVVVAEGFIIQVITSVFTALLHHSQADLFNCFLFLNFSLQQQSVYLELLFWMFSLPGRSSIIILKMNKTNRSQFQIFSNKSPALTFSAFPPCADEMFVHQYEDTVFSWERCSQMDSNSSTSLSLLELQISQMLQKNFNHCGCTVSSAGSQAARPHAALFSPSRQLGCRPAGRAWSRGSGPGYPFGTH